MTDILDKLSSYNILNYLLPGILFAVIGEKISPFTFIQKDIFVGAFIYYFIGLVISRIGSIIIEPLFKKVKIVNFVKYEKFVIASKDDHKLDELSEANNMFRTLCSVFILLIALLVVSGIVNQYPSLMPYAVLIALVFLLILFVLAYRKQTSYVVKRVNTICKDKDKE